MPRLGSFNKYNKRAIETSKIIEELIELAKEVNASYSRGEENGMIKEEVVFYDAVQPMRQQKK